MSDTAPPRRARAGLGRGLGALLGEIAREEPVGTDVTPSSGVRMLPIAAIVPHPQQPRRRFGEEALDELAASIAQRGVIQPIVVRPHGHDYQIVAGERRWRAAQRARLHEVPVVVREFSDAETLEVALIENIQRQDLNAIEEAEAYQRLATDFGHTQEELARLVQKSRSHVANLLRLLDLPDAVRSRVVDGALSMGHARALIGAPDPTTLADQAIRRGMSVREIERLASTAKQRPRRTRKASVPATSNADLAALENQLADLLGVRVRISFGESGGSVTLDYSTLDQLDMICQRLTGEGI